MIYAKPWLFVQADAVNHTALVPVAQIALLKSTTFVP